MLSVLNQHESVKLTHVREFRTDVNIESVEDSLTSITSGKSGQEGRLPSPLRDEMNGEMLSVSRFAATLIMSKFESYKSLFDYTK